MQEFLAEMLQCPACGGELKWQIDRREADRIEAGEARCSGCGAVYPVREGIGIFLTPDLPRQDMWENVDSQLLQELREHPELERRLMGSALAELNPADQFLRGMVLDERGEFAAGRQAAETAWTGLYTPDYLKCWQRQQQYVAERLRQADGPVVDLASGRGYLVRVLAETLSRPIVATDFSPRILRHDRRWLEFFGLAGRVSLLAFDARRTPFKDGAVHDLTTNLGLPNIQDPGRLLAELKRAVSGTFLAISHFLPPDDAVNVAAARRFHIETHMFREPALAAFTAAGWQVEAANVCRGLARPTPRSEVFEGAGIDALPEAETTTEWCTLVAR